MKRPLREIHPVTSSLRLPVDTNQGHEAVCNSDNTFKWYGTARAQSFGPAVGWGEISDELRHRALLCGSDVQRGGEEEEPGRESPGRESRSADSVCL